MGVKQMQFLKFSNKGFAFTLEVIVAVVIFDSLTTLGVYNNEKAVEKFIHTLSQKTKTSPISDVFLIMKHSKEEFIETVVQFFDKIIEL
jgi:hypothetical protein